MSDLHLPLEIKNAFEKNARAVESSGREIDQEFIRRGFVGVKAEIALMQEIFGITSYDVFLEVQSSREAFERYQIYESGVREKLELARRSSGQQLDEMWGAILHDPGLSSVSKSTLLGSISASRVHALFAPHLATFKRELRQEENEICCSYPSPAVSLYDERTTDLRKEVWNTVMADSYGQMGFEVYRRNRGVDSYFKILGPDIAVIIEPDSVLMQKNYTEWRPSPSVYWPLIPLGRFRFLGTGKKKGRQHYITFSTIANCVAANRLSAYNDTRSLELIIRADALLHQLAFSPFEQAVHDFFRN
jgi:hypothetical protein